MIFLCHFSCFVGGTTNPASRTSEFIWVCLKIMDPKHSSKTTSVHFNRVIQQGFCWPPHPSQCNGSSSAAKMMSSLEGENFFSYFFWVMKVFYVKVWVNLYMYILSIPYLFGVFIKDVEKPNYVTCSFPNPELCTQSSEGKYMLKFEGFILFPLPPRTHKGQKL